VTGAAFNRRSNGGTVQSEDQVTFPMSRFLAVVGLGWALADHDLGVDELL